MQAPEFWRSRNLLSTALMPAGAVFDAVGRLRRAWTTPARVPIPVICAGNLVAGGAGKTPLALALGELLAARGVAAHFLSRGYGGRLAGPVAVDPQRHDFHDVGDEPLLLAAAAPCWVARDRVAGAAAAAAAGARAIVLDDGLQNPALYQDLAVIAIDGGYGFGNDRVMPAGPLREASAAGIGRVAAAVLIGADRHGIERQLAGRVALAHAILEPVTDSVWAGRRVVAFAGIGRPGKFFETLETLGADLVARFAFPDHHPYAEGEVMTLVARAAADSALLVTTAKDRVRLPAALRPHVETLAIRLVWRTGDDAALIGLLLDRAVTP